MNIVILWELSGIKSTEEQYIIAIYQIDTNYISVQVWSRSFIWMEALVNLESNKQYPTLVQHEDRKPHTNTSDECYCSP